MPKSHITVQEQARREETPVFRLRCCERTWESKSEDNKGKDSREFCWQIKGIRIHGRPVRGDESTFFKELETWQDNRSTRLLFPPRMN